MIEHRWRDARCLEPQPVSGIYDSAEASLRVAIIDGCVAGWWRSDLRLLETSRSYTLVAPHLGLPGSRAPGSADEVVVVPDEFRIARPGDGIVLSVAPDGTPSVFQRRARRGTAGPATALRLRQRLDTRDLVTLLAAGETAVQIAALTRLVGEPLDDGKCAALQSWFDRAWLLPETERIAANVLEIIASTGDRCLIRQARRALDAPATALLASTPFARIAIPEERIEALLAVLDAPAHASSHQVAEKLAQGLHPDHCGPQTAARCLSAARGAELEAALRARIDRDPTKTPVALHALGAYLGSERHAAFTLDLAATAPCHAIELLVARTSRLPVDQVAAAFGRVLSRRDCARGREITASVLAHLLTNHTVPEAAWEVLRRYLDSVPPKKRRVSLYLGCHSAARDRHAAADAVLALLGLTRCAPVN